MEGGRSLVVAGASVDDGAAGGEECGGSHCVGWVCGFAVIAGDERSGSFC